MVLENYNITWLLLKTFMVTLMCMQTPTHGDLLTKHQSRVLKDLKKLDLIGDHLNLKRLSIDRRNLEVYGIEKDSAAQGYLFIKEVRACSLTGCPRGSGPTEDQGYEYYDLSIITDANKVIKKITILEYFSDHGYQISSTRYLKKYLGMEVCSFSSNQSVKVDGISGATISYDALISSLDEFCELEVE